MRRNSHVRINEGEYLAFRISMLDRHNEVVTLLSAIAGASRNDYLHRWPGFTGKRSPSFFDYGPGGIVRIITDKNDFIVRVGLRENRRDVFSQVVIGAAQGEKDCHERLVFRILFRQFLLQ